MKRKILDIICCPKCLNELECVVDEALEDDIIKGNLNCVNCLISFEISNGIPRFVQPNNYASSFGYQWNIFRKEQIDSFNGTTISADRLWSETGWTEDDLEGKWVLDAGCGAGRFLDVIAKTQAEVIGIDISDAIDASKKNLEGHDNVNLIQASIYQLPFKPKTFDNIYCIGVIQHTPDPEKTVRTLPQFLKDNGEIALTIYEERKWFTKLHSKYLLRPITKRLKKESLLRLLEAVMPIAFPLTNFLFRLPGVGNLFEFLIPIANYVHEKSLTDKQRYKWAILDTFDMLSPEFDQPQKEEEVRKYLSEEKVSDVIRLPVAGLNLCGKRSV